MPPPAKRSGPAARPSSANGGSSTVPSPIAWRKPVTGSSPSRVCRQVSGAACAPPMPLSDCTRSSSEGSRPRPCCQRPIPLPCCSGHCSLPDRSTCARSMAGKRSPPSQSISRLTSPHDQIPSSCWRSRRGNSYHIPDGTSLDHPLRNRDQVHQLVPVEARIKIFDVNFSDMDVAGFDRLVDLGDGGRYSSAGLELPGMQLGDVI